MTRSILRGGLHLIPLILVLARGGAQAAEVTLTETAPDNTPQAFVIQWASEPLAVEFTAAGQFVRLRGELRTPNWTLIYKNGILPIQGGASPGAPQAESGTSNTFEIRLPISNARTRVEISAVDPRGDIFERVFQLVYPAYDPRGPAKNFWQATLSVGVTLGNAYEWAPSLTSTLALAETPIGSFEVRLRRAHAESDEALDYSILGSIGYFLPVQGVSFAIPGQGQFRVGWYRGPEKTGYFAGIGAESFADSTPLLSTPFQAPIGSPLQAFQARQFFLTWLHLGARLPEKSWLGLRWNLAPQISKTLYGYSTTVNGVNNLNQTSAYLGWSLDCDLTLAKGESKYFGYLKPRIAFIGGDGSLFFFNFALGVGRKF